MHSRIRFVACWRQGCMRGRFAMSSGGNGACRFGRALGLGGSRRRQRFRCGRNTPKNPLGRLTRLRCFFRLVLAQVSCAMCVESVGLRSAGRSKEKPCRGEGTVAQRSGVFHGLSARRWRPRTAREAGRWRHRIDAPRHVGPGGTPANEARTARAARDCPAANDWLGGGGGMVRWR